MGNYSVQLDYSGEYSLDLSLSLAAKSAFIDVLFAEKTGFDMAILIENSWKAIGVRLKQENKNVFAQIFSNPHQATEFEIKQQLERMLSLNTNAISFATIISNDAVVANIYEQNRGLRPVLFASPYEAAARAIIGHQLPLKQSQRITTRISEAHGVGVDSVNNKLFAFPSPLILENLPYITGLSARKVEQLRILGSKTSDWLSGASLLKMSKEEAMSELQKLPGIGPFSAELIMLRGVGDVDAFPKTETRLHKAMAHNYDLGENPDSKTLLTIADNWRPYRTWIGMLLRNSIQR